MKKEEFVRWYGDECFWCKSDLSFDDFNSARGATRDHVISRYYRKPGERVPIVASCRECNEERSKIETLYRGCLWEFKDKFDFLRYTTKKFLSKIEKRA